MIVCRMPEPALWLQARATFMRTTAAWSMAGHIVGLGDRHCDNLLIDTQSGMNVQIDFGHLFDSARDLPYPEVMAFRLTQNMVDSLGVYGVEGGLRTTCCAGKPLWLWYLFLCDMYMWRVCFRKSQTHFQTDGVTASGCCSIASIAQ